ncbi:alpha-N-arabinofuranosidase [Salinisphaera sp. LB1]|uniref:arabinosylfuranosidase ArfA n=1 Tax=Salinisphaera sp. LB1 TaxID=2183911 RepID=UPI000D7062A9|nr:alpha-N-arabinofuranosidase [Salinisphaera sp. LB1]AWN15814.1 Alpha-N-arabinofuranosidase [Salinisphaera sp. LB1]
MPNAQLIADRDFVVSELDRMLFGSFVEHMGRSVYSGIYEPDHPTADAHGFRGDVLALVAELGVTLVRYPGGNFLSGYNWEDGVGPQAERPKRRDLAWFSTESNQFGTNEFIDWCRVTGIEPMFGVNLGTRGIDEARRFIEYCNGAPGSALADWRVEHGYRQPHGIKYWCLGNEMDGPWQIGSLTAAEYGRRAQESAKVMRWVDPDVQLAACGSSNRGMQTFGHWEQEVLDHCFDQVDLISLHTYFRNDHDDLGEYFAEIELMDMFIREVVSICDAVAAKRRSPKRVMLSFDEWNVWYRTHSEPYMHKPGWPTAPRLIEEVYDFEDALIVGGALITLINNADRVKIACLAQLVNVIAPIMTEPGGPAWRQTIFWPFALAARHGHGRVLQLHTASPGYTTQAGIEVPYLYATAIDNRADGTVTLMAMNRHQSEPLELNAELRGYGLEELVSATELHEQDTKATNTADEPDRVVPRRLASARLSGAIVQATLQPASWNIIVLRTRDVSHTEA